MGALGLTVANDLASAALITFLRGKAMAQTITDKPLLGWLKSNQKTYPGGNNLQVSGAVQGAFMSDTPGFLQGITEDDTINFGQAQNINRWYYNGKQVIAGLIITWTELLKDGISVFDDSKGGKTKEHSEVSLTRLVSILENRLEDFAESFARTKNFMFWSDGSQDPKQPAGIKSLLLDNSSVGTTGGINRATYWWWRNRANLTLQPGPANADMVQFFNSELVQLRVFGGKPNKALCGSDFLAGLRSEVFAKGYFTMTGFSSEKATDLGMGGLHIPGLGKFEYDPTLDQRGESKRCYVMSSKDLILRVIDDEDDKPLMPERPYQYMIFLKNVTWAGVPSAQRLNSMGVYTIA